MTLPRDGYVLCLYFLAIHQLEITKAIKGLVILRKISIFGPLRHLSQLDFGKLSLIEELYTEWKFLYGLLFQEQTADY